MFQFQTGSIKRRERAGTGIGVSAFQFQTGSIKSGTIAVDSVASVACFNSKLVRLKETRWNTPDLVVVKFQFQTGSIKSPLVCDPAFRIEAGFNSKLVRLKASQTASSKKRLSVSIPNWFD